MLETIFTLAFSFGLIAYIGWAVNKSLNTPFEWEDDFWRAVIEEDLYG